MNNPVFLADQEVFTLTLRRNPGRANGGLYTRLPVISGSGMAVHTDARIGGAGG